ncbi:hypothetical protein Tco_0030941 [Tanacetum coccineum]
MWWEPLPKDVVDASWQMEGREGVEAKLDGLSKVEEDGEVRVVTRVVYNLVAKLDDGGARVLARGGEFMAVFGQPTSVLGASCTQRKVYSVPFVFSIPFVLSWGGSISLNSFLSSILLVVVMVVIVVVTVIGVVIVVTIIGVVVVITIIGVVIVFTIIGVVVVVIVGGVPSIIKLSFLIVGSLHRTIL